MQPNSKGNHGNHTEIEAFGNWMECCSAAVYSALKGLVKARFHLTIQPGATNSIAVTRNPDFPNTGAQHVIAGEDFSVDFDSVHYKRSVLCAAQ